MEVMARLAEEEGGLLPGGPSEENNVAHITSDRRSLYPPRDLAAGTRRMARRARRTGPGITPLRMLVRSAAGENDLRSLAPLQTPRLKSKRPNRNLFLSECSESARNPPRLVLRVLLIALTRTVLPSSLLIYKSCVILPDVSLRESR